MIQQDNARPHIQVDDLNFVKCGTDNGWNIKLICQPPNSPDLNVLDLGFFRAIDSIKDQKAPKSITQLIEAIQTAFNELTTSTLNKVFLSYQCVMQSVMQNNRGNNFKLQHIGKNSPERQGLLAQNIEISA
ncbi:unnamed protein product [Cuscuta epithymum]|uniref:Transposase n=1 Tax=Cuscuta epithymum TaxID=186058 RepID=A0AAV0DYB9_9ASTE|nr:unnamed protein product [Cuscuta epithymum]